MAEYQIEIGPSPAQSGWVFMVTVHRGDTYIRSAYGMSQAQAMANLRWSYGKA